MEGEMNIQEPARTDVNIESPREYSPANHDPLWTVDEIAHYLRLEPETVRAMAREGKLPAVKVGRVWRFKIEKIHEMEEKGGIS
jgi:excisionase family DNA binding protein